MDNVDTDGRRVEAIPHEQEKQTTPNIDNVDKRPTCEEEEAARRCLFAACATFDVSTSPPPFRAVGGKASTPPPR